MCQNNNTCHSFVVFSLAYFFVCTGGRLEVVPLSSLIGCAACWLSIRHRRLNTSRHVSKMAAEVNRKKWTRENTRTKMFFAAFSWKQETNERGMFWTSCDGPTWKLSALWHHHIHMMTSWWWCQLMNRCQFNN